MIFKKYINKECVAILHEQTKTEVLLRLINLLCKTCQIADVETLTKSIFYREQLMSTGIGLGIAIPHVRYEGITRPIIAIGIIPEGIKDYQSIDDQIVKLVIMILVGSNQHKEHIRLLSQIVSFLKNSEVRQKIFNAKSIPEILEFFLKDEC